MSLFSIRAIRQGPLLLALTLIPLLNGCGGGGGGGGSSTPVSKPMSLSAAPVDGLTAKLAEDKSNISTNGKVVYTETLTNTSAASISVVPRVNNGANVPNAKLVITDPSGTIVFGGAQPALSSSVQIQPNQSGNPPNLPGSIVLAPGQSLTQTVSVGVFTKQGTYAATATFTLVSSASSTVDTAVVGPLNVTVS